MPYHTHGPRPAMAAHCPRDPQGPKRAQRCYLQAAGEQVAGLEGRLSNIAAQLATLEQAVLPQRKPAVPRACEAQSLAAGSGCHTGVALARGMAMRRSQSGGGSPLALIHVSPRYAKVNAQLLRISRCNAAAVKRKLLAGAYAETAGKFRQGQYRLAMQSAPKVGHDVSPMQTCTLVAWDQRRSRPAEFPRAHGTARRLRLEFSGPSEALRSWRHWSTWSEEWCSDAKKAEQLQHPFPVLIPTKGRARQAHLNWHAPHCLGSAGDMSSSSFPGPLVLAVVEPSESAAYRAAWPRLPLLVLPEDGRGPAFVRWAIQRVCTAMKEESPGGEVGPLLRLPFCWLCDDNLTCFYRLEHLSATALELQGSSGRLLSRPTGRRRMRCASGPMFAEALCTLQRRAAASDFAVCGFLRDDGTASWKVAEWVVNSTSIFKVVLLNLAELSRLHVEYLHELQMFEDVCLNVQVQIAGGRLLKSMTYCYWADNKSAGGCASQRAARAAAQHATRMEDLIPAEALRLLSPTPKAAVEHVLEWIRSHEARSAQRAASLEATKDRVPPPVRCSILKPAPTAATVSSADLPLPLAPPTPSKARSGSRGSCPKSCRRWRSQVLAPSPSHSPSERQLPGPACSGVRERSRSRGQPRSSARSWIGALQPSGTEPSSSRRGHSPLACTAPSTLTSRGASWASGSCVGAATPQGLAGLLATAPVEDPLQVARGVNSAEAATNAAHAGRRVEDPLQDGTSAKVACKVTPRWARSLCRGNARVLLELDDLE